MRHVVAIMLIWKEILHHHERQDISNSNTLYLNMCLVHTTEVAIIRLFQGRYFEKDINVLRNGKSISKQSNIYMLDPFLDEKCILWVVRKIGKCTFEHKMKHPVLLPREGHITSFIIRYYHEKAAHAGRPRTINKLRSQRYWIIDCTSPLKSMISKCVDCRWFRGNVCLQEMDDLPSDRLIHDPPFTYCGIDMFGPFLVKDGRKQRKYYSAMFTCMSSRAVHIETTNSVSTDSFILALRRLISSRWNVRMNHTDNGTNFAGANIKLSKAFNEINHTKISNFLMKLGDWITWRRNLTVANNVGGVWDRQIHLSWSILNSMLRTHGESLNDESLRTLLGEVEGILNSRSITCESIVDVNCYLLLSPMQLLAMKTKMVMPSPGIFFRRKI